MTIKTSDKEPEVPRRTRTAAGTRIREVPAVRRATDILWHLGKHGNGQTLSMIARDLEIIPSTCLHILRELMRARLVSFEETSKLYTLGLGVLELPRSMNRHNIFIHAAQPYLNQLVRELNVSATALQLDSTDMVVVAESTPTGGIAGLVGSRVVCLSSSVGRLVAAHSGWNTTTLREQFNLVRWQAAPDFQDWLIEVRAADRRGYAVDNGEFRRGITSIAAPIIARSGRMTRAISINIVSAQLDRKRIPKYAKTVKETAQAIVAHLHD